MSRKDNAMEAIDAFLHALRTELANNPELTYRLLAALPTDVHFDSDEASKFLSPIEIVAGKSGAEAYAALEAFTATQLKKMATDAHLATKTDLKSKSKSDLIDLIVERAQRKISERSS